jgi:hypothetical protein
MKPLTVMFRLLMLVLCSFLWSTNTASAADNAVAFQTPTINVCHEESIVILDHHLWHAPAVPVQAQIQHHSECNNAHLPEIQGHRFRFNQQPTIRAVAANKTDQTSNALRQMANANATIPQLGFYRKCTLPLYYHFLFRLTPF